ncbi:unnamed protein product, partial [Mesorhabditis belari]|uniref:Neurotransmitter-gated ion-channel ligand-binding domain-containing protein n=1 Tax=Mesorhabditis belari TaxID=2138241 RepID=A0AAF3EGX0_9BILA
MFVTISIFNLSFFLIINGDNSSAINFEAFGVSANYSTVLNNANRVFNEIFTVRNYHKELAPMDTSLESNSSNESRLQIGVTVQMIYIVNLDMAQQNLLTYVELELIWQDVRLAWEPENFEKVPTIWIHCDQVWAPENIAENVSREKFSFSNVKTENVISIEEVFPDRFKQCKLYANGTVHYDTILLIQSVCSMNIERFPFDQQKCSLQFTSQIYDMNLINARGELFTKQPGVTPQGNAEWSVVNCTVEKIHYTGYSSAGMDLIAFWLTLKREPKKSRLQIEITIQLLYIFNLDMAQQYLSTYIELALTWQDVRLAWKPENFDEVSTIWVHCDQVWTPENIVDNVCQNLALL